MRRGRRNYTSNNQAMNIMDFLLKTSAATSVITEARITM